MGVFQGLVVPSCDDTAVQTSHGRNLDHLAQAFKVIMDQGNAWTWKE